MQDVINLIPGSRYSEPKYGKEIVWAWRMIQDSRTGNFQFKKDYMAVTAHWIDEKYTMKTGTLQFQIVRSSHIGKAECDLINN